MTNDWYGIFPMAQVDDDAVKLGRALVYRDTGQRRQQALAVVFIGGARV